jgi:histidine triad (HIT) family protein
MVSECIFCRILAGELEASMVYRDAQVCAFMDIRPVNVGHVLVVPVTHATFLTDLAPEAGAQMMRVAQYLAAGLRDAASQNAHALRCEGINLLLCDGAAAWQEVMHVHLHVIPRYQSDGFGLRLPKHYGALASRPELDAAAALLRTALPGDPSIGVRSGEAPDV